MKLILIGAMGAVLSNSLVSYFKWYYSVGSKFLKKAWLATISIVLANVFSQVFAILAFLLPLKVVILVGTQRIPRYFPSAFSVFDHETLILMLGGLSAVFYVVHLGLEKLIGVFSDISTKKLLAANNKVVLFENQEDVAKDGYSRYARSLGGGILILLISAGIAYLSSLVFFIILGFAFFLCSIGYYLCRRDEKFSNTYLSSFVKVGASVGFLLVFLSILIFFFTGREIQPLSAILTLILARQLTGKSVGAFHDMTWLNSRKNQLNVLFFHGHVLLPSSKSQAADFWSHINKDTLRVIIGKSGGERYSLGGEPMEFNFRQSGVPDVIAFDVFHSASVAEEERASLYLKIYGEKRSRLSDHEALILTLQEGLPVPNLLNVGKLGDFKWHLFDFTGHREVSRKEARLCAWKVVANMMSVPPSSALISSYTRSRQMMWGQINDVLFKRLSVAVIGAGLEVQAQLASFFHCREIIFQKLSSLPLAIVNPDLKADSLFVNFEKEYVCGNWGRWCLEPVGAGWPLDDWALDKLPEAVELARSRRDDLKDVGIASVTLSAFIYEFLALCQRQSFKEALVLLPQINSMLQNSSTDLEAVN
ncbi:hypothetical protein JF535_13075 [Microbulbifer salipaludis]|uniref:Uncharacterized protein n=1 Tax=Microbulbifer salipaludis TaxID=187980 RepID=A0ABS3E8Z4_9GAMM|nr:hypothetical protein [Microbulbifer salipaludis]MBN8431785.1 hypothetical protein [Microbulbifer salipaludis]